MRLVGLELWEAQRGHGLLWMGVVIYKYTPAVYAIIIYPQLLM